VVVKPLFLFVFMAWLMLNMPVYGDDGVTAEEIQAAFRTNFLSLSLSPCRMKCRRAYQRSEQDREFWGEKVREVSLVLESPDLSDDQRAMLSASKSSYERLLATTRFDYSLNYELWTDWSGYQVRWQRDPRLDVAFPNAMPQSETMAREFQDLVLTSYSPISDDARYRFWQPDNSLGAGMLSAAPFRLGSHRIPPTGFLRPEWGGNSDWHLMDLILGASPAGLRLLGSGSLDGRKVYRLEAHLDSRSSKEASETKGDVDVVTEEYAVLSIDPSQGFLPIRIEREKRMRVGETRLNAGGGEIDFVAEVARVDKIGDCYYPAVIVETGLKGDPQNPVYRPTIDELLDGRTFARHMIPSETVTYTVDEVIIDPQIDAASIPIPFPKGMYYTDRRNGLTFAAGMSREEMDKVIAAATASKSSGTQPVTQSPSDAVTTPPSAAGNRFRNLLAINFVALLVFGIIYFSRRLLNAQQK
jgi:hypothetical protein